MNSEKIGMGALKVLIVGGGIGGMAAAISLQRRGAVVDLVEIDPKWRVYGAGITISAATLRAFATLGILEQVIERGYCSDGVEIYDVAGQLQTKSLTVRLAGPDFPSQGGILRPVLREILSEATLAAGVSVRLGVTFGSLRQAGNQVIVDFSDGRTDRYDLVVGADGLRSNVRQAWFSNAPQPTFTGQGCWRAVIPRPSEVICARIYMGAHDKAGVNPVSKESMYLFLNARERADEMMESSKLPTLLRQRLAPYGGLIAEIRESLSGASQVLYRPLEKLMMPSPWYHGRVLLIGDAAHSTTPHLASGAGIAVEDALVLTDELSRASTVDDALSSFMARRFERCRIVVENSVRLGEFEQRGGAEAEHEHLRLEATRALTAPI